MASPTEIQAKIQKLQAILDAGVKSVTTDGVTTVFDLESIERQIKYYESKLPGKQTRRPTAYRVTGLGG